MQPKVLTLDSGDKIPSIGFGPGIFYPQTYKYKHRWALVGVTKRIVNRFYIAKQRQKFIDSIASAIQNGFRLIDYSETYAGYEFIREGIKKSGYNTKDLFITTRVGNRQQFQGVKEVRESFFRGLKKLGIDYVDLLQFHWPVKDKFLDTWKEMIRLKEDGYVRNIGVANCNIHHIESLYKTSGVMPSVNQVEVHPLFTQKPLLEYCRSKEIVVEAYTPIARYDDRLVRLPLLKELEKKYNKSFVQITLRWHIQNGIIPVVRAMNPIHQKSDIDIFDFEISTKDMSKIDAININSRLRYDPDNCDFTIL